MKNKQAGFIFPLVIVLVVIFAIGGGAYVYSKKIKNPSPDTITASSLVQVKAENSEPQMPTQTPEAKKVEISAGINSDFVISGNSLLVQSNGKTVQTISLTADAIESMDYVPDSTYLDRFILDQDVNFDGHNDVGVFLSSGYGGVNDYYQYYILNPKTGMLEKNSQLDGVSNPKIDTKNKAVISSFRSGPQWYTKTFTFNGSSYIESEDKPEIEN